MEGQQESNIKQNIRLNWMKEYTEDGASLAPYFLKPEDWEAWEPVARKACERADLMGMLSLFEEKSPDGSSYRQERARGHNPPKYASTFKAFLVSLLLSVIDLSPQFHWALLMLSCAFLIYQAKNITTQFHSQFGKSPNSNPPHSLPLLSFSEAFVNMLPVMKPIIMFILSYPLTLLLACPIQLILQILIMLVLIFVPFHYFSELVGKVSSGVNVAFGSFHLPLIGFTIFGGFALSFIVLFVILIGLYLLWRYILKGRSSLKKLEGSVQDLSQILIGV